MTTPSRPDPRRELVTDTGWRLVGQAVSLVNESPGVASLPMGRPEDALYAAKFRVRPRLGGGSAVDGLLTALGQAVSSHWEGAPPLTRDSRVHRMPGRFHGVRWDTIGSVGEWTGELLWRHPHPVVGGAPCTTHAVIVEQGPHTEFTVRVTADAGLASVRGTVGAGQARPQFLTEMNRSLALSTDGSSADPTMLEDHEIDAFVRDLLLSDTRTLPVAVLAPLEDGSFVVPPHELANELLGLAQLYAIQNHRGTFRLSDSVGDRRLSCYWGALRIYMPEFSCADSPEEHPLLVQDRLLDPVMRAAACGSLGRGAALRITIPPGVAERRDPPPLDVEVPLGLTVQAEPAPSGAERDFPDHRSTPARESPDVSRPVTARDSVATADDISRMGTAFADAMAPMQPLFEAIGAQISSLSTTIARLVEANARLTDEIERLRTTNSVRAAGTNSVEKRLAGMERLLERALFPDDFTQDSTQPHGTESATVDSEPVPDTGEDDEDDVSLLDVIRHAGSVHPDALLMLDNAERAAESSPYEDSERVAAIIDAMAAISRRRQAGSLGNSLRQEFRDLGIDYRGGIASSTSDRMQQQYQITGPGGRIYDCREHIVLGTSYDPRHCLRIYFTSRAPLEPRFVIGHVGRHFEVKTTT